MKFIQIIILLIAFTSCASNFDLGWGKYSLDRSDVTGDEIHSISRAPIKSKVSMYVDLYKNKKSDKAVMTIYVGVPHVFASGESLQIRVDDKIYKLKGLDPISGSDLYFSQVYSSQRYEVTKDLLQAMLNGENVFMRVDLLNSFVEGDFGIKITKDELYGNLNAKKAFQVFFEKAWASNTGKL